MAADTFRAHLPALAGSVTGALASAIGASYFGAAGTFPALVAGTILFGTASWWAERLVRRGHEVAAAKAKAVRQRGGRPLSPHETQVIERIVDSKQRNRQVRWQPLALTLGAALCISVAVIGTWQLAAGKPVTEIVYRQARTAPSTPAPAETVTVQPTPTQAVTPTSAAPTIAPATVAPSPTPSLTPAPTPAETSPAATVSPEPSPAAS